MDAKVSVKMWVKPWSRPSGLTFASKEALEKHYLHEPAHQEFVAMLGGVLEKALVVDYVAG